MRGGGTGFHVISPSGKTYILTNNHVCQLADKNDEVVVKYGSEITKQKVLFRSKKTDLCLVHPLHKSGISVANNVGLGQLVNLVGHPGLRPLSVSKGEIIGSTSIELVFGVNLKAGQCFGRTINVEDLNGMEKFLLKMSGIDTLCIVNVKALQFNGISYPGNSGSPVVNDWGNLIGVLFAGNREAFTDSFLIPLDDVKEFLSDK